MNDTIMTAEGNDVKDPVNTLQAPKLDVAGKKKKVPEVESWNPVKLSISNQESEILTEFGENPYLRSLFFVAVANRHVKS